MNFSLTKPVVYVVRDLERALGLSVATKGYYIISNYTAFANSLVNGRKNILLLKENELLDTRDLLSHPKTRKFIGDLKNPNILVFKNTTRLEKLCGKYKYNLLNPSAETSTMVEEKITQVEWLEGLKKYLPSHEIKIAKDLKWSGDRFILQFNHAHTGNGTILVEDKKQLQAIQKDFPDRPVRVTKYVDGIMLTNNNVVWGEKVLCGNINVQITGFLPFTTRPFATVGNDWSFPHKLLNAKQKTEYIKMAKAIGEKLVQSNWKGLFGIDVMLEKKTGKLFLIEINARQPASTSFESILQQKINKTGLTTFQAHILALIGQKNVDNKLTVIKDGAQITQKVLLENSKISNNDANKLVEQLHKNKFDVFVYDNTEFESDLVRVQSANGILQDENTLNKIGEKIKDLVQPILKI